MEIARPHSADASLLPRSIRGKRLAKFLPWALLALVIWCAKLWTIRTWGDSCPFGDEWSWEAEYLLKPAQEHTLSWGTFFAAINEHRIFMTRLFVLGLFKVNGIWDPRLQMAVQALLHASAITLLLFLCVRGLVAPLRYLLIAATCLFWILPFGWENTLFGFQSQFYFVILFGVATIWQLWRSETLSAGWWIGVLLAIAGLFTMASGWFACVLSTGMIFTRLWVNPPFWRRHLIGFLILAVLTVVGFLLIPHAASSDPFKARTPAEWWDAWRLVVSWPQHGHWFFLIFLAPVVLLLVQVLRRRPAIHDRAWLILTLTGWGLLQSAALAYGRARLTPVAPRYLDVYVLLLCTSFACFCEWYRNSATTPRLRRPGLALAGLWIFCGVHGALTHFVNVTIPELDNWTKVKLGQGNAVRQYLESHDPTVLSTQPSMGIDVAVIQACLDSPSIAEILPTHLRPPIGSTRQTSENAFFSRSYFDTGGSPVPGHLRYWSSYGPDGAAHIGEMEMKFPSSKRVRLMEFFVAGAPNANGMSLLLTDKNGQRKLAPDLHGGRDWNSVLIKIPPGGFSISAKDGSAEEWLAISNPREVGLLSHHLETFLQLPEADGKSHFTLFFFTALVVMLGFVLFFGSHLPKAAVSEESHAFSPGHLSP